MGYNTSFEGELKFSDDLTIPMLVELNKLLGEDVRDLPHVEQVGDFNYFDLELLDDYSGIKWNGSEKTRDMPGQINTIIKHLRDNFVDYPHLTGNLVALGEERDDSYRVLVQEFGGATKIAIHNATPTPGSCPHCGEEL